MRRREFFGLAIGCVFGWPRPTLAQQSRKLPVIAFLGGATPAMWAPWTGAFVDRLKALGWIDNREAGVSMDRRTTRTTDLICSRDCGA